MTVLGTRIFILLAHVTPRCHHEPFLLWPAVRSPPFLNSRIHFPLSRILPFRLSDFCSRHRPCVAATRDVSDPHDAHDANSTGILPIPASHPNSTHTFILALIPDPLKARNLAAKMSRGTMARAAVCPCPRRIELSTRIT
jgi:hypothetical protein